MSSVITVSTTSAKNSADYLPLPPQVIEASPSTKSPFFTHLDHASPAYLHPPHRPTEWLQSAAPSHQASFQSSSLSSDPADDPYDYLRRNGPDPATDHDSSLSLPLASDAGSFARLQPVDHVQPGRRQRSASGSLRAAAVAASHAPASITARTRRHLSKLSNVASPRDSDADSVLSEPASYSNSSYVASDMWLVHRDVDSAERMLKQKERERQRDRDRHRPRRDVHRGRTQSATADMRYADVFSPRNETQDVSSKLVRMFFSGESPSPGPRQPRPTQDSTAQRPRSRFGYTGRASRAKGYGAHANLYEHRDSRLNDSRGLKSFDDWDGVERKIPLKQNTAGQYVDDFEDEFGGYHRRRFDRVRRFRWWLRRIAFKFKGEAE